MAYLHHQLAVGQAIREALLQLLQGLPLPPSKLTHSPNTRRDLLHATLICVQPRELPACCALRPPS